MEFEKIPPFTLSVELLELSTWMPTSEPVAVVSNAVPGELLAPPPVPASASAEQVTAADAPGAVAVAG